jgi:GAF domain-containing protein
MPEPVLSANPEECTAFFASVGLHRLRALPGLDNLLEDTLELVGADLAGLVLFNGEREFLAVTAGLVMPPEFPSSGLFAHVRARPRSTLLIEDLRYDPRTADSPLVIGTPFLRGFAAAPVTVGTSLVVGTLALGWVRPHQLSADRKPYLRSAAVLAALLIKSLSADDEEGFTCTAG